MEETKSLTVVKPELTKIQLGWLKLADKKTKLFEDLQKDELKVQELCNKALTSIDLPDIQLNLKEAKEVAATSKEQRLGFTNLIKDRLIEPAMEFEKRNELSIEAVSKYELETRKESVKKNESLNAKNDELARLKAHINNEYLRIALEYNLALETIISESYTGALKAKMKPKEIPKLIEVTEGALKSERLSKFVQFDLKLISKDEAKAVFKSISAYDPANDLYTAINSLNNRFSLYSQDLKQADKVIAIEEQQLASLVSEVEEKIETESAVNTLVAQGETFTYSGGVKIHAKMKPVEENSFEWLVAVCTNFIKYAKDIKPYTKNIKEIPNIKASQLAAYLVKFWEDSPVSKKPQLSNLKMEEIQK